MNPTDDCYWRKAVIGEPGGNVRFGAKRTLMIESERMRKN